MKISHLPTLNLLIVYVLDSDCDYCTVPYTSKVYYHSSNNAMSIKTTTALLTTTVSSSFTIIVDIWLLELIKV